MFGNGKKKKDGNAKNSAKGTKRPNSQSASTKASKESQTQQKQRKRAATNRSFDETTTTIRRGVIDSCIKKKEAHLAEREKAGKSQCAQGFMKQMIEEVKEKCPALDIQKDDIENEIKRREGEKEKKEKKRKKSKSNKAAKTNPPKKNHPFVIQGRRISSASSSAPAPPPLQPTNTAVLPSSQPNTSVPQSWQGNMALNVLATLASAVTTSASTLSSKMMLTVDDMRNFGKNFGCQVCGSEKVLLGVFRSLVSTPGDHV